MHKVELEEVIEEVYDEENYIPLTHMHAVRYARKNLEFLRDLRKTTEEYPEGYLTAFFDCCDLKEMPMLLEVGRTRPGYVSIDSMIAYFAALVDFKASLKSQSIDIYGENHPSED